jgi:alpha-tubulin suppressor-like RCC1 family protein
MSSLTTGNKLITIVSTNNIGIGTKTPTSKLTVGGDIHVPDITYTSTLINRTSTAVVPFDTANSNLTKFTNWLNSITIEANRNWWANTSSPLFSKITTTLSGSTNYYSDSILLPDGRVVFVPYNAPNVGIFNSRTNIFSLGPVILPAGINKYVGGVLLPDGRVIFIPYNAENIGIYNPVSNTFSVLAGNLTGNAKYYGGVLLPNGYVLFVPNNSTSIGIYNPFQNIYSTAQSGLLIGNNKFRGGVLCPDGKVVFIPKTSSHIGIYDYFTNTYDKNTIVSEINTSGFKQIAGGTGYSMFLSNEGKIFTRGFNTNGQIGTGKVLLNSLTLKFDTINNYFTSNGITIVEAASGETHSIFLTNTGVLYGVGRNSEGQLGIGNYTNITSPVAITLLAGLNITKVYCGQYFSMFLTNTGRVYATGQNQNGQLGINNFSNTNIPTLLTHFTTTDVQIIDKIACGFAHTLFLARNKTVYACGLRTNGRLGTSLTTVANIGLPAKILFSASNNIIDIATCNTHSLFLTDTNTVLACGNFANGKLGTGSVVDIGIPIIIQSFVDNNIQIAQVSAGEAHSLFLTSTGTVYACGLQTNGRLGNNSIATTDIRIPVLLSSFTNVKQVSAAREFSCFLKINGSLYTCGQNANGKLGNGTNTNDVRIPTLITSIKNINSIFDGSSRYNTFVIQSTTNIVYGFGYNNYGQLCTGGINDQLSPIQPLFPANFANINISQVSSGGSHTIFLEETTGKLYATGLNTNGQVGVADLSYRAVPHLIAELNNKIISSVSCGSTHSLFVHKLSETSSDVYACGQNAYGELANGKTVRQTVPVLSQKCRTFINKNTPLSIVQVDAGESHSLFLTNTGVVYGVGRNSEGQLGVGDYVNKTTIVMVHTLLGIDIEKIYCGYLYSMFIERTTGKVYACGQDYWGNLGLGNITFTNTSIASPITFFSENEPNPHIITSIACGTNHTLFLTSLGLVFGCGYQGNGRIGNNSSSTSGIYLPVQITGLPTIKQVSVGDTYSIFLANNGSIYVTGNNANGQLGMGNTTEYLVPTLLTFFTTQSLTVSQISTGWDYTLFLTSTGTVYACGLQTNGRLGNGLTAAANILTPVLISTLSNIKIASTGNSFSVFVSNTGFIYTCGNVANGRLGNPNITVDIGVPTILSTINNVDSISIGFTRSHTLIKTTNNSVYSFGYNNILQLGISPYGSQSIPIKPRFPNIFVSDYIVKFAAGWEHSLFLANSGVVYGVGRNSEGQLGVGNANNRPSIAPITALSGIVIEKIYCGYLYSMFIEKTTGRVYGCGQNNFGQVGIGGASTNVLTPTLLTYFTITNPQVIVDISCGWYHTHFITSTGTVFACGLQRNGQFGNGTSPNSGLFTPIQIISGTILTNIKQISAGEIFSLFLKTTGEVYATGNNGNGQLGTGNTTNLSSPTLLTFFTTQVPPIVITQISCGYSHSLFLTSLGKVYATGSQSEGRLGNGLTGGVNVTTPVLISTLPNIKQISAAHDFSSFLTTNGDLYMCGYQASGRLANLPTNTLTPTLITSINNIDSLPTGSGSSRLNTILKINNSNDIYVFGYNSYGQLGIVPGGDISMPSLSLTEYSESLDIKSVKNVSAGTFYSMYLTTDGLVYGCGINSNGQLGLMNTTSVTNPTLLTYFTTQSPPIIITKISAGNAHTLFLTSLGTVYSCGLQTNGRLGNGFENDANISTPFLISGLSNITHISAGLAHSLFLTNSGIVYVCGLNVFGQLGINNLNDQLLPVLNTQLNTTIVDIFASTNHSVFIDNIGSAYVCGYNLDGSLNINDYNNQIIPYKLSKGDGYSGGVFLPNNNIVMVPSNNINIKTFNPNTKNILTTPMDSTKLKNVKVNNLSIGFGENHQIVLQNNNFAYSVGLNTSGQLGLSLPASNIPSYSEIAYFTTLNIKIIQIATGTFHTLYLTDIGTVYATGLNSVRQLGLGDTINYNLPFKITLLNGIFITNISARGNSSFFVTDKGTVYACGLNTSGKLGLNDIVNKNVPTLITQGAISTKNIVSVSAGTSFSICLDKNGRLYSSGLNTSGELGINLTTVVPNQFNAIEYFTSNNIKIIQIASGNYFTLYLTDCGTVYGTGYNPNGQLGLGNTTNRNLPLKINALEGIFISKIATRGESSLFLSNKGTVYGCGINSSGQLGLGDAIGRTVPTLITLGVIGTKSISDIFVGNAFTLCLDKDGALYSSGTNGNGELGIGFITQIGNQFNQIQYSITQNIKIIQIASGSYHTLYLTDTGIVYANGYNGNGQLGVGDTTNRNLPVKITALNGIFIVQISAVVQVSLFLTDKGTVYGCGINNSGQLGVNDAINKTLPVLVTSSIGTKFISNVAGGAVVSVCLEKNGRVYSSGLNTSGEMGISINTRIANQFNPIEYFSTLNIKIIQIATGSNHTLYLTDTGTVYAAGYNNVGQLGLGNTTNYNVPLKITALNGIFITNINARSDTSLFLSDKGTLYGCGLNTSGQLGLNDIINKTTPTLITQVIGTKNISNISVGAAFSVCLEKNGRLYSSGLNTALELGLSINTVVANRFNALDYFTTQNIKIIQIATGSNHTLYLTDTGTVYSTGLNTSGQLGLGDLVARNMPFKITALNGLFIVQIDARSDFSLFLTDKGTVYGTGLNSNRQIGGVNTSNLTLPALITGSEITTKFITKVSAGATFSLFISSEGKVYECGLKSAGISGTSTVPTNITSAAISSKIIVDVSSGDAHAILIDSLGSAYSMGIGTNQRLGNNLTSNNTTPTLITTFDSGTKIASAYAGNTATIFLTTTGTVYVCGDNIVNVRRLGSVTNTTSVAMTLLTNIPDFIVKASIGTNFCHYLSNTGKVYAFGSDASAMGVAANIAGGAPSLVNISNTALLFNIMQYNRKDSNIEYLFNNNLNDTGTNAQSLTLQGTNSLISLKSDDITVGRYLKVACSGTDIVSASAPITTTTSELISSTITGGGSGLTISFDMKWDYVGNGNGYFPIGIGQGISAISNYSNGTSTTATGIVFGRDSTNYYLMFCNSTGQYLNYIVLTNSAINLLSNLWKHIDIVFYPTSMSPDIYVNNTFIGNIGLTSSNNAIFANTLTLAASSATRTHFAVEGTDEYSVANFRLWKKPLTFAEIRSINPITQIAAGLTHSAFLSLSGIAYSTGLNTSGQLGIGDLVSRSTVVTNSPAIKFDDISAYKIASGTTYTVFVNNSGLTYAFGTNTSGQLGFGNTSNVLVPTVIPVLKDINICQLACGTSHAFFVENNGRVYACGSYLNGRLGIASLTSDVLLPTNIPFFNTFKIVQAAAGDSHSLFLSSTGQVYACGSYLNGRLGTGSTQDVITPIEIAYFSTNGISITQISEGDSHSMFLSRNGVVYACGSFANGRLGTGSVADVLTPTPISYFTTTNPLKIKQVSCGSDYTMFLTTSGSVYACGAVANGKLGTGSAGDELLPILVSGVSNVRQVATGYAHTLFLTATGVYSAGLNTNGQLGNGDTTTQTTPVLITSGLTGKNIIDASCGSTFSVFITNETTSVIYSCGSTTSGNVPSTISYLSKETNTEIVSVSTGDTHTIIVDNVGNAYAFGAGANLRLGTDNVNNLSTPRVLTYFIHQDIKIASAYTGNTATIFLSTAGKVYVCGDNIVNVRRLGSVNNITSLPVTLLTATNIPEFIVKASIGSNFCHYLSNTGKVYAFGNDTNAIGSGGFAHSSGISPTIVGFKNNSTPAFFSTMQYKINPYIEYLFNNNLNDTGTNAQALTISEKTFVKYVEYLFNRNFLDTSGRNITLQRTGTGTDNTIYVDDTLGFGYGYLRVLPSYTVSANIAPTTTYLPIASKVPGAATGARILFKIKLNNTTPKSTAIFSIGKIPNISDTGVSTWVNVSGNASAGVMIRNAGGSSIGYVCVDANGNFTQFLDTGATLSTSAWTFVEIVFNKLIDASNKMTVSIYINNVLSSNVSTGTTTSFDFSYAGGVNNNLLRFTGYEESHNIADFKIVLDDDRTANSLIVTKADDPVVGNYLQVAGTGTGVVSASAPITTGSAAELISSTTLSGGSGLTISFDFKWDMYGNGAVYYIIGIGQGINAISSWFVGTSLVANGVVIGKGTNENYYIMLCNSAGQYLNYGDILEKYFSSTNWQHIDIVFYPTTMNPDIYINGTFINNVPLNQNQVASSFYLEGNSATRTHFAIEGTDAYRIANFRLWKRPLTIRELGSPGFITQISAGATHAVFLTQENIAYSTGSNTLGQLGIGHLTARSTPDIISPVIKYNDIVLYKVASGSNHTIFINNSGLTYSFGTNTNGQLGFGNTTSIVVPTVIPTLKDTNIRQVAASLSHSLFVESTGRVYACGSYFNGRLGISGLTQDVLVPTNIPAFNSIKIIQVAAGDSHSLFLSLSGRVYACGSYLNGRLGTDSTQDVIIPTEITYFRTNSIFITQIATGNSHSMFLDSNGIVYTCGSFANGRLGTGSVADVLTPIPISYFTSMNPLKIKQVSCGSDYTMFLTTSGSVYACGSFADGKLGTGSIADELLPILISGLANVREVIAGYTHTLFLNGNGAYATGLNANGQLGNENTTTQTTPVLISTGLTGKNIIDMSCGSTFSVFITNETTTVIYSCGSITSTLVPTTITYTSSKETNTEIVSISTGHNHTILIDNIGNAYAFGSGGNFRLGSDNGINLSTPMLITYFSNVSVKIASAYAGSNASVFLTTTGSVYVCGFTGGASRRFGSLSSGNITMTLLTNFPESIIKATFGANFCNYLSNTGIVYSFGNDTNAMGTTASSVGFAPSIITTFTTTTNPQFITQIVAGDYYSIFLTRENSVYACGANENGQLGLGDTGARSLPVINNPAIKYDDIIAYEVVSGLNHTLVLNNIGLIYSLGTNTNGQLGLGHTRDITVPTLITPLKNINIVQIACGSSHSFFIEKNGTVYACGSYLNGRLGIPSLTSDLLIPTNIPYFNTIKIIQIAAGSSHSLFLASNGKVYACGSYLNGRLGLDSSTDVLTPIEITYFTTNNIFISQISAGDSHSMFLDYNGNVYGCGSFANGRLGLASLIADVVTPSIIQIFNVENINPLKIKQVSCGSDYTMFLTTSGSVYSCGAFADGRLATGSLADQSVPGIISSISNVRKVIAGYNHTLFLTGTGVYASGLNTNGQLGNANTTTQATPVLITTVLSGKNIIDASCGSLFSVFITNEQLPVIYSCGSTTGTLVPTSISYVSKQIATEIVSLSSGNNHTIAIDNLGNAYAFGAGGNFQLGTNNTNSTAIPVLLTFFTNANIKIASVTCGDSATIFLTTTGTVWVCGNNVVNVRRLGAATSTTTLTNTLLTTTNLSEFIVKASIGSNFCHYLSNTGKVYTFGNDGNAMGAGGTTNAAGGVAATLVSSLSSQFITQISAGLEHALFLTRENVAYSTGRNSEGQLGLGDIVVRSTSVANTLAFKYDDLNLYKVASGLSHTIFINNFGLTYSFGTNTNGQLGIGNTANITAPQILLGLRDINVCQIACGASHSLFVEKTGRVYACGSYLNGRLGILSLTSDVLVPTNISYFNTIKIIQVAAGSSHSLFLDSNGKVYACGSYLNGRLGTGSVADVLTPVEITYFSLNSIFIKQISAGNSHSMFLDSNGNVYACGAFANGRLGTGSEVDVLTPSLLSYFTIIDPTTILQVSCGSDYTMFLTTGGNVYTCGSFADGKLGTGSVADELLPVLISGLSTVREVIAGYTHTLFLTRTSVLSTGLNTNGQLGNANMTTQTTPVIISELNEKTVIDMSCGSSFSVFITNEKTSVIYSCGSTTSTLVPVSIPYTSKETNIEIVSVSAGDNHTIVVDNVGNAYSFGLASLLRLGTDTSNNVLTPMLITYFTNISVKIASAFAGNDASIFVTTTGTVYVCGNNVINIRRLGALTSTTSLPMTLLTNLPEFIIKGTIGTNFCQYLSNTGKVYAFGSETNAMGTSASIAGGAPSLVTTFTVTNPQFIKDIYAGQSHSVFLTRDGIPYSSGSNTSGQLGTGDIASRATHVINIPTIKYNDIYLCKVASSRNHTVIINNSGLTYSFGTNANGQLGFGNTNNLSVPTIIPALQSKNIRNFACGSSYSLFVENTGRVYACGSYLNGRLGIPSLTSDVLVPTNIPYFNSIKIIQVATGSSHSLFLDLNGRVYACGAYLNGQLGTESTQDLITPTEITYFTTNSIFITQISAGDNHSMFLDINGNVYGCGAFANGRIGIATATDILTPRIILLFTGVSQIKIKQVSCGSDYTMFLTTSGNVYTCGSFANGKLGTGSVSDEFFPVLISGLSNVREVIAGENHTLFLAGTGVYSTGLNTNGQLGNGNTTTQNIPILITSELSGKNVIDISCGSSFSVFITNDTSASLIYSCGSITSTSVPLAIPYYSKYTNTEIVSISTHESSTILVDTVGNAYGCGTGANSRLGIENGNNLSTPMLITYFTNASANIASVCTNNYASIFVSTTGEVYSCGYEQNAAMLGTGGNVNSARSTLIEKMPYFTANSIFIVKATIGYLHSLLLSSSGVVYAFGRDSNAMGTSITPAVSNIASTTPSIVTMLSSVVITDISVGYQHSLFLASTGIVYSTGLNSSGQLGLRDLSDRSTPTTIQYLQNVKQISAGLNYSVFLLNNGTVYSCGANSVGQLGLGDIVNRNIPVIINALEGIVIVKISASGNITKFMSDTGDLYVCGLNTSGQLGLGDYTNRLVPTRSYVIIDKIVEDAFNGGTLLPDGRVLFTPNNSDKLGIFNPATNTFSYDTSIAAPLTNNYQGNSLLPDGRIIYAPNNDNTVGMLSGLQSVPLERCIHPTFNSF